MPPEIVVDAMGSDHAPESEIQGAIRACRKLDVAVVLVGPEDRVRPRLEAALAGERLGDRAPDAVRRTGHQRPLVLEQQPLRKSTLLTSLQ